MNDKRRDPGMMTFEFGDDGSLVPDFGPGNPLEAGAAGDPTQPEGVPASGWGGAPAPLDNPFEPRPAPAMPAVPGPFASGGPAPAFGTPRTASGGAGTALLFMAPGPGRDALAASMGSAGLSVLVSDNPLSVASLLYGLRPAVVLVDAAQGPFMASQSVQWLRLSGLPAPVVSVGNVQPAYTDGLLRAGVSHCVPYPTDLALFASQLLQLVRQSAPPAAPVPAR